MLRDNSSNPLSEFCGRLFICKQFKPLDAIETFVPAGQEEDEIIEEYSERTGTSRWYPVEGGHRVIFPYLDEEYDSSRFKIMKGAWNHEHCDGCGDTIEASEKCWVTESEPYALLCEKCYEKLGEK